MKITSLFLIWCSLFLLISCGTDKNQHQKADVLVYGATPSGIMSAIAVKREGKSVLIVEPIRFVGGSSGPTNVPYPIPYRSITLQRHEVTNLLVPVLFSASHLGYASARMEPTFMIAGESAGVAAVQAIDEGLAVQESDISADSESLANGLSGKWKKVNSSIY